jgi:hypothetical protein
MLTPIDQPSTMLWFSHMKSIEERPLSIYTMNPDLLMNDMD